MDTKPCQYCQWPLLPEYVYCPHCGKRVMPFSISFTTQVGIYLLSILLPPLGIIPAIKYLKHAEAQTKRVGTIALILTIIATVGTILVGVRLVAQVMSQVQLQTQQYQSIGI